MISTTGVWAVAEFLCSAIICVSYRQPLLVWQNILICLSVAAGRQQSSNVSSVDISLQEKNGIDNNCNEMMLVMSGGEGYIDFRVGATNTGMS